MGDFERARVIALNLLDGGDPPDEAGVRRAAEIAVQAVRAQGPGSEIDTASLIRELEANVNVVVGPASTLTDDESDHVPWLADRRASIEWGFTRRYQRFLKERKAWATAGRSSGRTTSPTEFWVFWRIRIGRDHGTGAGWSSGRSSRARPRTT